MNVASRSKMACYPQTMFTFLQKFHRTFSSVNLSSMSKVDHLVKSNKNFLTSRKSIGGVRGDFSSTSGNVTDEIINHYINQHSVGNTQETSIISL